MIDNIIRFIWAILTASFVGLIVYFRKPLMSILHALADMDSVRAGPVEFTRRRQQLIKYVGESKDDSVTEADLDEKRKLLKMSVLALITGVREQKVIEKVLLREIKEIYEKVYKDLSSFESESAFLAESSEIIAEYVTEFDSL